ncbi:MAG: glutathione synthase, partial [Pirellulales bacterium]
MKIGFVVNDVQTEQAQYTTTRLAMTAIKLGHEAWTLGVADFEYAADGSIRAIARTVKNPEHETLEAFLEELQGEEARVEKIDAGALDVLMLRNDPSEDKNGRAWAQTSGILFGQLAMR